MSDPARLDALRARYDAHPSRGFAAYADALRSVGRVEEAASIARRELDRHPRNVYGQVVLARCLRDLGHPEEGADAVRAAMALDPEDPAIRTVADLLLFAPHPEADPVVPETAPPVFVTETMAELYVQQGLPHLAEGIYRELVARAPLEARLAERLAEVEALATPGDTAVPSVEGDQTPPRGPEGSAEPPSLSELWVDLPSLEAPSAALPEIPWLPAVEGVGAGPEPAPAPVPPDDLGDAFDFTADASRAPDPELLEEGMLDALSFDAIALETPSRGAGTPVIPLGVGPTAREALRALVRRPVTPRAVPTPAMSEPPTPVGDDFDRWLRGLP